MAKLSELLRQGFEITKASKPWVGYQVPYFQRDDSTVYACPLVAAALAAGLQPEQTSGYYTQYAIDVLNQQVGLNLRKTIPDNPIRDDYGISDHIIYFYDVLEWDRERILNWVVEQGL